MQQILYHVMLEGRRLGPYDRRTIVGMRVRKTLTSRHVLECSDGARMTVAELLRGTLPETPPAAAPRAAAPRAAGPRAAEPRAAESRAPAFTSSVAPVGRSYSVIQAAHPADLLEVHGRGHEIPPFKGEVEVRVQSKVLRISGRFRELLAWKEDRAKLPLRDIVHARLQGSVVDLGVRPAEGSGLQRVRLDLRTPEAARELVEALPHAVPWPGSEPLAAPGTSSRPAVTRARWAVMAAGALAAAAMLAWALARL